jgi:3-oxoacyl-[acyl-carrier protein] reductase
VAEKAGVSISTVSRFLNHKVVSPQAEERIREAVRELAYIPNRIARSLKLKRTMTLGMAIPDITNTFFPEIVKGVEDAARAAGFHLVLTNTGEDQATEWERLNTLETLRCDGCLLILAPDANGDTERKQRLADYRLPVVYLDRSPPFDADMVISDNVNGAEEAVRHLVGQVETALGAISLLVNCAGGDIAAAGGKPKPNDALGIPLEDVHALIDRNLIGTMLVCRAVCPGMRERRSGVVVNIGSTAAHVGLGDGVVYAVVKAAIVQWTRCLAQELRPHGVRVNAVSPGPTMTARFLATRQTDPRMRDESVPLERYGLPSEVADAVAFLCSDAARFVNGQLLRVDGGSQLFAG